MTTVPMPANRSSLVWMETPARATELMALPDAQFAKRLQLETHGELGLIGEIGPRKSFPMRGLTASVFARNRLLLVGEAAHVVLSSSCMKTANDELSGAIVTVYDLTQVKRRYPEHLARAFTVTGGDDGRLNVEEIFALKEVVNQAADLTADPGDGSKRVRSGTQMRPLAKLLE